MSRSNEERARRDKLVIVAKRFWTFFVLGVICIFLGVTFVAVGNNIGNNEIKLVGFICGCCGIFLDVSSLLYISVQRGRDLFPLCCFKTDSESESSRPETGERDLEGEGSLRSSSFERPPSYRTCLKMKNPDSPPSYSEVILSISKTNVNSQIMDNNGQSENDNHQMTGENAQLVNEHTPCANDNTQQSNGNVQSANENTRSTNGNTQPTSENTQITNENAQSLSESCDNGQP